MDNKNLHNFDEVFREKLYAHEVTPPPLLFEQIKTQIALQNPTISANTNFWQKHKSAFIASALSLMLGAFLASLYWVNNIKYYTPKNKPLVHSTIPNTAPNNTNLIAPPTATPLTTIAPLPTNNAQLYNTTAQTPLAATPNINILHSEQQNPIAEIKTKNTNKSPQHVLKNEMQNTEIQQNINKNDILHTATANNDFTYQASNSLQNSALLAYTQTLTTQVSTNAATSILSNPKIIANTNTALEPLNPTQHLLVTASSANPLPQPAPTTSYKTNKNPYLQPTKTTGLHGGYFATFNNTWIINPQAMKATKNKLDYKLTFGRDYGFNIGYDFNEKMGIQAEYIVSSWQGQKYQYQSQSVSSILPNETKKIVNTDINLRYTAVPVLFKYHTLNNKHSQPKVLNYSAGIECGMLKTAEINLNNTYLHRDLLKKYTLGVTLGIDYDMYIARNYYFSVGTHAKLTTTTNSITEINLPSKFTSNNLIMGIRAGLNYRFK